MSKEREYCPLCNLIMEPENPGRRVRAKDVVHEWCIMGKDKPKIIRETVELLRLGNDQILTRIFERDAKEARTRQQMTKVIVKALARALNETGLRRRKKTVLVFAESIGDRLLYDVVRPLNDVLEGDGEYVH